ncbi:hypothetical protein CP533_2509 [Ophiocordyceps camponoti-saundersi (nom. inval.)]|nr:hypothetical protein CP533_2509 [Ophiocordyceps camponoti-saundersi (nom. inval.)]
MSLFTEDTLEVPNSILDNDRVSYGFGYWVFRFDAVAKCFLSKEPQLREREIAVYERLKRPDTGCHDAILPFYGVLDGKTVLLQFAPNGSIRQYYARHGHHDTPLQARLRWAEQLASAVIFIQSKGVVHGDISCNNIFLDEALNAKLGNFVGSSIDGSPFLTAYETAHSLPDDESVSIEQEIFALGSTLYEMMTGSRPFDGMEYWEVETLFRQGRFPPLDHVPALGTVISKCWNGQYGILEDVSGDIKQEQNSHHISKDKHTRIFSVQRSPVAIALLATLPIAWLIR